MIYILNRYAKDSIGHYWNSDSDIRKAFRSLKFSYTFLNPTASIAQKEDGILLSSVNRYIEIKDNEDYIDNCVKEINSFAKQNKSQKIIIFLTWTPMFSYSEIEVLARSNFDNEVSIVGISIPTTESLMGKNSLRTYYSQEIFEKFDRCKVLWVGEEPQVHKDSPLELVQWVDFLDSDPIDKNRHLDKLSFYGLLSAHRGISEIFLIALFNPKLKVEIRGYGYSALRTFRPFKRKIFRYKSWKSKIWFSLPFILFSVFVSGLRFLPNISFSNKPFESEKDLSKSLSMTGALFYFAKLPYGSGLVMKSLVSGLPVLWIGDSGYAHDLLQKHFNVGKISYHEVFIPGRVHKKFKSVVKLTSNPPFVWQDYLNNLSKLESYF